MSCIYKFKFIFKKTNQSTRKIILYFTFFFDYTVIDSIYNFPKLYIFLIIKFLMNNIFHKHCYKTR